MSSLLKPKVSKTAALKAHIAERKAYAVITIRINEPVTFTYYGNDYYNRSGSAVGVLYTEDGRRSDWGKVNIALGEGKIVKIIPATIAQHRAMEKACKESIKQSQALGFGGPWGPAKPAKGGS